MPLPSSRLLLMSRVIPGVTVTLSRGWLVVALCLGGCGGGGGDEDALTTPANATPVNQTLVANSTTGSLWRAVPPAAARTILTLPGDAVSLLVQLEGSDAGNVTFSRLQNPAGSALNISHLECYPGDRFCSLLVPQRSDMTVSGGNWTLDLAGWSAARNVTMHVTARSGSVASTPVLPVKAWHASSSFSDAQIAQALQRMTAVYRANGMDVAINATVGNLTNARYRQVSSDFRNATTAELVSHGIPDAVNLFFIEDFSDSSGTLGIASAIPGSQGRAGGFNGVLLSLQAHTTGTSLDTDLLGETSAHETGHFLGLYHTSEFGGTVHDILDDTPRCTSSRTQVSDCLSTDGANLMFWTIPLPGSTVDQTVLTADQVHVLGRAPLAR
ncbi:MAG: hypothetical protein H7831_11185 [Magnetococcus sp. WYHC-3]